VLWRLEHFDIASFRPQVAVVLIGTNNTRDTPEDIAAGVKAVIAKTQQVFPRVKVVLTSILPNARAKARTGCTSRRKATRCGPPNSTRCSRNSCPANSSGGAALARAFRPRRFRHGHDAGAIGGVVRIFPRWAGLRGRRR
jgi:hypothetical protein